MFKVKYKSGSGELTVYNVRENEEMIEFLLHNGETWYWEDANFFIPFEI
jgi:hypothetical protein